MKKIIIFLVFTFILTSCFSAKDNENPIQNSGSVVDTSTGEVVTEETKEPVIETDPVFQEVDNTKQNTYINSNWEVIVYESFKDYEIKWDVLMFEMFFSKNEDFFKNNWEIMFYDIWNDNIFWTNKTGWIFKKLTSCFQTGETSNLDTFMTSVCKWKNSYDKYNDVNPAFTKTNIIEYKKAYKNKDYSCKALLEKKYDFIPDRKHDAMKELYLICEKFKNPSEFSLKKASYELYTAKITDSCSDLKDKNLSKLCNEAPNKDPLEDEE